MARIRTIKPEISQHELLFDLEQETGWPVRFFWAVLPCHCDREGRFEWRPRPLKNNTVPYDDIPMGELLDRLVDAGMLERYTAEGKEYGRIPTFAKHQRPNAREPASEIPDPDTGPHMHAHAAHEHAQGEGEGEREGKEISPPDGGDAPAGPPPCPQQEVIRLYHELLPMCPPVRDWHETRQGMLRARWRAKPKHQSLDFWRQYFEHVSGSPFLTGQTEGRGDRPPFCADLEWLVKPTNFAKVIEGKYHNG